MAERGERVGSFARLGDDDAERVGKQDRVAVAELARDIDLDADAGEALDPLFADHGDVEGCAAGDDRDADIAAMAHLIAPARDVLYLGRGPDFPLALEGALKLKEISYIHAEGYAAGELKHGPIALVDEATPIVILAPFDSYFEKSASNMSEVMARGGQVVFITDPDGVQHAPAGARVVVTTPRCDPLIAPLVMAAPIQLLAYYVAVQKGADVDQPRNLAKSVTVE